MRAAASPIRAGPAVPRLELFQATAARVGQINRTTGLFCGVTFLTSLLERRHQKHVLKHNHDIRHYLNVSVNPASVECGLYLQSVEGHLAAWADFTDPSLFHQFALGVAVGHPDGHSSATGFRAGRPICSLRHTH